MVHSPLAGSILDYLDAVIRVLELGFHPRACRADKNEPDRRRSRSRPTRRPRSRWRTSSASRPRLRYDRAVREAFLVDDRLLTF
jgi:hypothetical protein